MDDRRKHGGLLRTAAVIIALPVLYVGSFIPACWISSWVQPSGEIVSRCYQPILRARFDLPMPVKRYVDRVIAFGLRKKEFTTYPTGRIFFGR